MNYISQQRDEAMADRQKIREKCDLELFEETERLKNMHRNDLNNLRKEHEEAIDRLKKVKDKEIEAIANSHDHSK